jgi:hypothetical protein
MIIQLGRVDKNTKKRERLCLIWSRTSARCRPARSQPACCYYMKHSICISCTYLLSARCRPSSLFIRRPAVCFHASWSVRDRPKNNARAPRPDHGARSTRIRSYYWNQTCSCVSAARHDHGSIHVVRSLIICKCDRRVFYYVRAR